MWMQASTRRRASKMCCPSCIPKRIFCLQHSKSTLLASTATVRRWMSRFWKKSASCQRREYGSTERSLVSRAGWEDYHYHSSRYRACNMHSVFYHGTIEWRLFNSTLHAGEAKPTLFWLWRSRRRASTKSTRSSGKRPSGIIRRSPSAPFCCGWG